ncbi:MAG: hypothetical protein J6Y88_02115 [Bacteroidales bacterium]|nr:hypothetical protein [Bacteroidales bacterium]
MELYALNLHLFEGEGAAAAAGEAGAQGEAAKATVPGNTRRGKSALSNVLYGTEAPAAESEQKPEVKVTSDALEEKRKAFKEMIAGEYKDMYAEEFQNAFNRRFSDYKKLQQDVENSKPILDKLAARYNIMDGDLSKLEKAIDDDRTYWAAAAEEAGMDEDSFREMQNLKRQNAELLRFQQEQQARTQADMQVKQWMQEADVVKTRFPNFDFANEMNNPDFVKLLRKGTPVEHAYKLIHFDELMSDNALNTQRAVTENIRAKGARPAENGTSSQSPFTVKRSASQLNRADRSEIVARVRRGEQIGF